MNVLLIACKTKISSTASLMHPTTLLTHLLFGGGNETPDKYSRKFISDIFLNNFLPKQLGIRFPAHYATSPI